MCGIAGFCDFNKKTDKNILKKMTDVLYHRGPDDSGYSFIETEYANIGLAHRRLSILDLSTHGHQPMKFDTLEMVYNGEVYNFQEIKKELIKLGYSFESESDSEVILKAYHKWGIKAIHKFNGMFAISIYDSKLDKLVLIRDRTGVKPLYYYFKDNNFLFASELKSFHEYPQFNKDINKKALTLYFKYGYILQPYTIFKNTYKLKAGHYLEINLKTKKIKEYTYWDISEIYNREPLKIDEKDIFDEVERLMISSFKYRMVSDVPIGVFLSGGYDSSIVTAILQKHSSKKLNTFTIGFEDKKFNEAIYAKKVANYLETNHHEYYCTQKDALDIIPTLSKIYDEPFADSSAIPTILVSKFSSEKVKVVLSADGGDEIFAGYDKYFKTLSFYNKTKNIPDSIKPIIINVLNKLKLEQSKFLSKRIENFSGKYLKIKEMMRFNNIIEQMDIASRYFTTKEIDNLLENNLSENINTYFNEEINNDYMNQMLAIDYKTYLSDDILTKVDRATMSTSIEGREPLLDYRIIEFVAKLPSNLKYKNNVSKYILKEISYKYLPKDLMQRPKQGFAVPMEEWFKEDLKIYFDIYLDYERLKKENILNIEYVEYLKREYFNGRLELVHKLWFILIFEMWYERWM